ncbi:MAG: lysostaphin resistance A-like protein [Parvularculaceae bacterium]
MNEPNAGAAPKDARRFTFVFAGSAGAFVAALILGALLQAQPLSQIGFSQEAIFAGAVATLPPLLFNYWFSKTANRFFARLRRAQLDLFSGLGFTLTPSRILLLAIGAGVGEEFLFRGVLQTWIDGFAPVWAAIIAPNILFAILHAHNAFYAVAAGFIGVYFGVVFYLTGDLTAPVLTHMLYDLAALEMTRRAMLTYRSQNKCGE